MMAFDNNMTTALRRPCRFLQGDMLIEHENATCGPIFGMGSAFLFDISKSYTMPNIRPHRYNGIHITLNKMIWPEQTGDMVARLKAQIIPYPS